MAAQFSDDAYNKYLTEPGRSGTLVGNWFEERSIREATGEGRSVPQRHIPRSGLLTDWTAVPACGPRKQDNTFERMFGAKFNLKDVPLSKIIGAGEEDITGETPLAPMLQAEGRIARVGARELACKASRREVAEKLVQEEEAELQRKLNERCFDTTYGGYFQKPDESLTEKAAFLRKSCKEDILHGRQPDRSIALRNAGMDIQTNVHYSNTEGVTHSRMSLVDKSLRNDMKVSACQGFATFGRNSEFSKPTQECNLGHVKDDELEKLFQAEKTTNPMKTRGGVVPTAAAFAGIPSLALVKDKIHQRIKEVWGSYGYVTLRHQLYDCSDSEGFVSKADAVAVFRNNLGLSAEDVTDAELDVYLSQQVTMRKTEMRITSLMGSLRPALLQAVKLRIKDCFASLSPVDGVVRLGSWLVKVEDEDLRNVITNAFGAEDEAAVADVPLTESTLVELLADLHPFVDVMALLP
mmetsp:Transcript_51607/g.81970  ORF Transcript_51607/g.81970 Transcript_51607/m.81970 type:complete len:466 (-) Transcript_51607:209-1606(-)|eukprot:CAMPEP_0169082224 /NCGR_PEP_ID=MMETSP1015-20121227/11431_1 /TAXON_ID=342587 /ORGANISM="Karlodinium micrum, Strain CCMP2283" /LENGTH=465 /DNA_ID=CAMNT_0009142067 /DNA_START=58 /DNA_END=1455 /DNA_ORIENTATION=-